jgi:hypothetical protein
MGPVSGREGVRAPVCRAPVCSREQEAVVEGNFSLPTGFRRRLPGSVAGWFFYATAGKLPIPRIRHYVRITSTLQARG